MGKEIYWQGLSDQELLNLRLCDLQVSPGPKWIQRCIARLGDELQAKGLCFRPHIWTSDEWFCPDGIPGLALPFFLFHPRLRALERKYIGEVEGGTEASFMKLLRHEAGHAIDNAFGLRKVSGRQRLFGSSKVPYPSSYVPNLYSRQYVAHLPSGYAQSHPDEDFAETFAVWLTPKSRWQKKYSVWPALKKLEFMDTIMSELKGKRPLLRNRRVSDDISKQKMTLREYYQRKRKALGKSRSKELDSHLQVLFSNGPSRGQMPSAAQFIRSRRIQLRRLVAEGVGQPQYRVDRVIGEMVKRAQELELYLSGPKKSVEKELLDVLTTRTIEYVAQGKHRVIM